jgi:DNA repair exonuclease SbcCD ATPase subunit
VIKAIEISSYGSIQDTIRVPLGHVTLLHGANGSGKSMICRAIATALTSEGPLPLQWWKNASSKARVVLEFAHQTLGNLKLDREFSLTQTAHGKKTIFVQNEIRVDGNIRPDISLLSGLINVVYLSFTIRMHKFR